MTFAPMLLAAFICLLPVSASADTAPATPLTRTELETLTRMEDANPAHEVRAGDFSSEAERSARLTQFGVVAASGLAVALALTGLAGVWKSRRTTATQDSTDRRTSSRYAVAAHAASITLHTPYGEINADPVDISEGGIQIRIREERPNGTPAAHPQIPEKIKISLSRVGAHGSRILDHIPCMICWVCKDRLGLRFDGSIVLDPLFAQRVAVPVPLR